MNVTWWSVFGFALAVLPICLTPGVSFTLVTQRVIDRGVRSGFLVITGTAGGILCHAVLAGAGLSALVIRSSEAFTAVKLAGAVYLIGLGLRTVWRTRPSSLPAQPGRGDHGGKRFLPWSGQSDLLQGFLGNVLNPKAAAVYLTIAPQFLRIGHPVLPQMLVLGLAHVAVAAGWLMIWLLVVNLSRRTIRSLAFRRSMDRVSGTVLVGLGLRTALSAR